MSQWLVTLLDHCEKPDPISAAKKHSCTAGEIESTQRVARLWCMIKPRRPPAQPPLARPDAGADRRRLASISALAFVEMV